MHMDPCLHEEENLRRGQMEPFQLDSRERCCKQVNLCQPLAMCDEHKTKILT